ncbi:DUF1552 domain-containing protein [Vibrio nomapromontoriensis]|uniref:DUF1552 domain-containing protein n=1 Tax=Vibrio nomapromontoriensis TaxID=2910246 RepID=UPI003D0DD300
MTNHFNQSRRNLLKTSIAASVGLGFCTLPTFAKSTATNNSDTKFIFVNFSDGYPRGKWHPKQSSNGLEMNDCTAELEQYKDHIVFFSGCKSTGGTGHDGYKGVWQENVGQGSIDFHFENYFSSGMPKRALRLGVDTNYWGHGGFVTSRNLNGALMHNDDPQAIFNDLFGGDISEGNSIESRKLALLSKSIPDIELLEQQLGGLEAAKTNAFRTTSQDVNTELNNAIGNAGKTCNTSIFSSTAEGRDRRADLQVANAALALSCEKTRIVSLQLGTSNDSKVVESVSRTVPHDASHYSSATLPIYIQHRRWYLSKVTRLIELLKTMPDTGGSTLFDNSIIMVTSEMDDGQAHSSSDLPFVLIGGNNTKLATEKGGRLMENVGPIGQILAAYSKAYGVSIPYKNAPLSGLFHG